MAHAHEMTDSERKQLKRRYGKDLRFRIYCIMAMSVGIIFLLVFLTDLIIKGVPALQQTIVQVELTYSERTMFEPQSAVNEEARGLVSHTVTRDFKVHGQRVQLELPVQFTEQVVEDPIAGVEGFELTKEDFNRFYLMNQDQQPPYSISTEQLRSMIAPAALEQIQKAVEENPDLIGTTEKMWLWASDDVDQFTRFGAEEGAQLPAEIEAFVLRLEAARRSKRAFNTLKYAKDREVTPEWVLADSDVDQYMKGKYSSIGFASNEWEKWMDRIDMEVDGEADIEVVHALLEEWAAEARAEAEVEEKASKQADAEASGDQVGEPGESDPEADDEVGASAEYASEFNVPGPERLTELQRAWVLRNKIENLKETGEIKLVFNKWFFGRGNSKHPEAAGILPAVIGSVFVLLIVFVLSVPIGVLTSIYLEEFAPDNWLTRTIEININNLAAIPSILFGVLGLAVFISPHETFQPLVDGIEYVIEWVVNLGGGEFDLGLPEIPAFGMPRSSALVGGCVLALMTLPIVIIATRAALRAVPNSIRKAGHAMGATRWQVVVHHVLPQSISGILTGSIIGLAQAMGETAPLIIVGLVMFDTEPARGIGEPTVVMPAQIFEWWGESLRGFSERAALAILCLLVVLFIMNGLALYIRARSEKRW